MSTAAGHGDGRQAEPESPPLIPAGSRTAEARRRHRDTSPMVVRLLLDNAVAEWWPVTFQQVADRTGGTWTVMLARRGEIIAAPQCFYSSREPNPAERRLFARWRARVRRSPWYVLVFDRRRVEVREFREAILIEPVVNRGAGLERARAVAAAISDGVAIECWSNPRLVPTSDKITGWGTLSEGLSFTRTIWPPAKW